MVKERVADIRVFKFRSFCMLSNWTVCCPASFWWGLAHFRSFVYDAMRHNVIRNTRIGDDWLLEGIQDLNVHLLMLVGIVIELGEKHVNLILVSRVHVIASSVTSKRLLSTIFWQVVCALNVRMGLVAGLRIPGLHIIREVTRVLTIQAIHYYEVRFGVSNR